MDDGARKADTADHCAAPSNSSTSSRDRDVLGIIVFGNNISERSRGINGYEQAKTCPSGMF